MIELKGIVEEQIPIYHLKHATADEYFKFEDGNFKYELIDGVMNMTPSANFYHSTVFVNLLSGIKNYLESNPVAKVTGELDIRLSDNLVYRPDINIIFNERLHIIKNGYPVEAPDIAIEILSEGTKGFDFGKKADDYFRYGVKEYWIVDPMKRCIYYSTRGDSNWITEKVTYKLESSLLPGLELDLEMIFS